MKLLKLPEPKDETAALLLQLERQLAQARASRDSVRAEKAKTIKALERELAACQAEVQARAMGVSAQARAACTGACAPEPPPAVPGEIVVSRDPEGESSSSEAALELVSAMRRVLLDSPPQGVEPDYIDRFFHRYQGHLARIVDARMPQRSPTERLSS